MTDIQQKTAAKAFAKYWEDKGYEKGESQPFWISLLSQSLESAVLGLSAWFPLLHSQVGQSRVRLCVKPLVEGGKEVSDSRLADSLAAFLKGPLLQGRGRPRDPAKQGP